MRYLTEPQPPLSERLSEDEQLRQYLTLRSSGGLLGLRESMGGPYPDAWVDAYVRTMERKVAKVAPGLIVNDLARQLGVGVTFPAQPPGGIDQGREF